VEIFDLLLRLLEQSPELGIEIDVLDMILVGHCTFDLAKFTPATAEISPNTTPVILSAAERSRRTSNYSQAAADETATPRARYAP
jgi:hypothetical protein